MPNVLLEAAATGRICIASDINGSRDVIENGKTGFLFKAGDADDLTSCMRKVIFLSDEERTSMGRAGREKVEKEFDRQIVIEKYCNEVERA